MGILLGEILILLFSLWGWVFIMNGAFLGMKPDSVIYNIYVWRFTVSFYPYSDLAFNEEELDVVPWFLEKAEYLYRKNIENE